MLCPGIFLFYRVRGYIPTEKDVKNGPKHYGESSDRMALQRIEMERFAGTLLQAPLQ